MIGNQCWVFSLIHRFSIFSIKNSPTFFVIYLATDFFANGYTRNIVLSVEGYTFIYKQWNKEGIRSFITHPQRKYKLFPSWDRFIESTVRIYNIPKLPSTLLSDHKDPEISFWITLVLSSANVILGFSMTRISELFKWGKCLLLPTPTRTHAHTRTSARVFLCRRPVRKIARSVFPSSMCVVAPTNEFCQSGKEKKNGKSSFLR